MSINVANLTRILQLCDSASPLGAYSHSWGLETLTQYDLLKSEFDVEKALRVLIQSSLATREAVAVKLAYEFAENNDLHSLSKLNQTLTASSWNTELHNASIAIGERLKNLAMKLNWLNDELLSAMQGQDGWHHCVVFGWLCQRSEIDRATAICSFLYTTVNSLVAACVKLIPLGHTSGQKLLANLAPVVEIATEDALKTQGIEDISSFAPMLEWASFEHETLYSRLFQS